MPQGRHHRRPYWFTFLAANCLGIIKMILIIQFIHLIILPKIFFLFMTLLYVYREFCIVNGFSYYVGDSVCTSYLCDTLLLFSNVNLRTPGYIFLFHVSLKWSPSIDTFQFNQCVLNRVLHIILLGSVIWVLTHKKSNQY